MPTSGEMREGAWVFSAVGIGCHMQRFLSASCLTTGREFNHNQHAAELAASMSSKTGTQ